MNELLLQIGVGGAFCVLVLRQVLEFLRNREGNGKRSVRYTDFSGMIQQLQNVIRTELIASVVETNTNLREIRKGIEEMIRLLERMNDKLDRRGRN